MTNQQLVILLREARDILERYALFNCVAWCCYSGVDSLGRSNSPPLSVGTKREPGIKPGFPYRIERRVLLQLEHLHRRRTENAPDLGAIELCLVGRLDRALDLLRDRIALRERTVQ